TPPVAVDRQRPAAPPALRGRVLAAVGRRAVAGDPDGDRVVEPMTLRTQPGVNHAGAPGLSGRTAAAAAGPTARRPARSPAPAGGGPTRPGRHRRAERRR